jgi:hypothetical protein
MILLYKSFSVLNSFDLVEILEVMCLLVLVQIDEMQTVYMTQLVHYIPVIVFGDHDLIKIHVF